MQRRLDPPACPPAENSYPSAKMKTLALIVCATFFSGMVMNANAADKLQHVVSLKFKTIASPQDITKVEETLRGLKQKISQIVSLEWGTNISKKNHDKGFSHCFILAFKTEQDRDIYIEHPAHKAFGQLLAPVLEDVFVIDFWNAPEAANDKTSEQAIQKARAKLAALDEELDVYLVSFRIIKARNAKTEKGRKTEIIGPGTDLDEYLKRFGRLESEFKAGGWFYENGRDKDIQKLKRIVIVDE
jgi:hypothetical protein